MVFVQGQTLTARLSVSRSISVSSYQFRLFQHSCSFRSTASGSRDDHTSQQGRRRRKEEEDKARSEHHEGSDPKQRSSRSDNEDIFVLETLNIDPPSQRFSSFNVDKEALGSNGQAEGGVKAASFFDPSISAQQAPRQSFAAMHVDCANRLYPATLSELCDRSIILSRQSSAPHSYTEAQELLRRGTRIYIHALEESDSDGEVDPMSYESFLIRSTYAQVIRTIGALMGREGVDICGALLQDYLEWELELLKRGFRTADGSLSWWESRRERALEKKGNDREKDLQEAWLISSGPFLQDFAPILFDVFYDLTLAPRPGSMALCRSFASETRMQSSLKLLKLLRRIPNKYWDKSASAEWHRFRNVEPNQSQNNAAIIGRCHTMFLKACLSQYRLTAAIILWREEARKCDTVGDLETSMMSVVANALRKIRRDLRKFARGTAQEGAPGQHEQSRTRDLKEAFFRASSLLAKCLRAEASATHTTSTRVRDSLLASPDLKTILSCISTASTFSRKFSSRLSWSPHRDQALDLTNSIEGCVRELLKEPLQGEQAALHTRRLDTSTCNSLLTILINLRRVDLASELFEAMISHPWLPQPNDDTSTLIIRNAHKLPRKDMVWVSFRVAHMRLQLEGDGETITASSSEDLLEESVDPAADVGLIDDEGSHFFSLLDNAAKRNDTSRVRALLLFARMCNDSSSSGSKEGGARILPTQKSPLSAERIALTLFPSLSINRTRTRRRRKGQAEASQTSSGGPYHGSRLRAVMEREALDKFRMPVLLEVLNNIVRQRQSGTAERFFRMMRRVEVRWEQRRQKKDSAKQMRVIDSFDSIREHWTIPARAYKMMFELYLYQVRFSSKLTKRMNRLPQSRLDSKLASQRLVRGWARTGQWRFSPSGEDVRLRNDRAYAARVMTMKLYEELRSTWPLDHPALIKTSPTRPDHSFFKIVLRIFAIPDGSSWPPRSNSFLRGVLSDMKGFGM